MLLAPKFWARYIVRLCLLSLYSRWCGVVFRRCRKTVRFGSNLEVVVRAHKNQFIVQINFKFNHHFASQADSGFTFGSDLLELEKKSKKKCYKVYKPPL